MAFIDYYKILGVEKDIPQKDVKKAYLKRAKQFHPDLHPDDPKAKAKFQALNEAYDVIGDPEKRHTTSMASSGARLMLSRAVSSVAVRAVRRSMDSTSAVSREAAVSAVSSRICSVEAAQAAASPVPLAAVSAEGSRRMWIVAM